MVPSSVLVSMGEKRGFNDRNLCHAPSQSIKTCHHHRSSPASNCGAMASAQLAVPHRALALHRSVQGRHRSGYFEGGCGRRRGRACRGSSGGGGARAQAAAEAAEAPSSLTPPIAQELWAAPAPCRLIRENHAFTEEYG